ncbi:MAG: hypothetical protein IT179_16645 [Acidobacteria bacterium]|nr:hypothetical protein [Acidobacteriota bacterium]
MIGLDTNILVRYLVQDDAAQARAAAALEQIARTGDFTIEHADHVRAAVAAYKATSADFADALVGRINEAAGWGSRGQRAVSTPTVIDEGSDFVW